MYFYEYGAVEINFMVHVLSLVNASFMANKLLLDQFLEQCERF